MRHLHWSSKFLVQAACLCSKMSTGMRKEWLQLPPAFQLFYEMKFKTSKFEIWHFEASQNIMTKFKSQGLHVRRIKYYKAGGRGNLPFLIPALWSILLHKQATLTKHFDNQCMPEQIISKLKPKHVEGC